MKERTQTPSTPAPSDDPDTLEAQARESIEKSAAELRKTRVPIATEPPTVYRP
jgi:hypothetical protein